MSRRRSTMSPAAKNLIVIGIVAVVVIIGVIGVMLLPGISMPSMPFGKDKEEEQVVEVDNVSSDISAKLGQGTALSFGAPASSNKPVIAVVGDPEVLSRSGKIINGKPSDLMNAINRSQVTFYYYPVSETKKTSTDSITRASICRIGAEKTSTGIFTLTGIVSNGDKMTGSEDVKKVSSMMKMSKDVKCPVKTNQASTQTALNAEFFAEHFGLGRDGNGNTAIVVDDEVITNPDALPDDWAKQVLNGIPLREIVGADGASDNN